MTSETPCLCSVETRDDLAPLFKALAHPVRLAILRTLAAEERTCCGRIVDRLPLAQSTVSQHLQVLKDAGLVRCDVVGRTCRYSIDRAALARFETAVAGFFAELDCCLPHAAGGEGFRHDEKRRMRIGVESDRERT